MASKLNLYGGYGDFKEYQTPDLREKHIAQFDREFWKISGCTSKMSVLEIGCGTGQFLRYLAHKEVQFFRGLDHDPALSAYIHNDVAGNFVVSDAFKYFANLGTAADYNRVVMFDVLEHFSVEDGANLLSTIKSHLASDGQIIIRVPNMSSPWGGQYQYGDLTHKAAYTPGSMRQLAGSLGLFCSAVYPQKRGSRSRNLLQNILQGTLNKMLVDPPEIWSANFIAVLGIRKD